MTPCTPADLQRLAAGGHAELRALLCEVLTRLERIEAAQRAAAPAVQIDDADAEALRDLLPALARRWPARVFTAGEVWALVEIDSVVRETLRPFTAGKRSPANSVGWLLRRGEGVTVAGHSLRAHGDSSPRLFTVEVSNPRETGETPPSA